MPHKVFLKSHNKKHNDLKQLPSDLVKAFDSIVAWLGRDNDLTASDKANLADTVSRATKAFMEMTLTRSEIGKQLREEILCVGFPMDRSNEDEHAGIQLEGPILMTSFCPHHLQLVVATAFVAYVPSKTGHVLGLSKIPRLAQLLAKRPVLQEQLTCDIADTLYYQKSVDSSISFPAIETSGSAVLVTGKHACVSCRGVKSQNLTTSVEVRGIFTDKEMEDKFYQMITLTRGSEVK